MKRLLTTTLLLAASVALAASPPERINFQGVLRDNLGNPRDGDVEMTFRFFDAELGGAEILIDTHAVVTVDGGLFNAQLGGGVVSDGAGPGLFDKLPLVFQDPLIGQVWMQIEIDDGGGVEVLSPRVEVLSTAFALQAGEAENAATADSATMANTALVASFADNADQLDGLDSTQFLDTTATDQVKSGSLTVQVLFTNGNEIRFNGPDRDQDIRFYNSESVLQREILRWDEVNDRLEWYDEIAVQGPFSVGHTSSTPVAYNRIGIGVPDSGDVTNNNDLFIGNDLEIDSALYLHHDIFFDGTTPGSESLGWNDLETRFEFSDSLATSGPIAAGSLGTADTFNRFGTGASAGFDISSSGDVFVSFDLEVGDQIYMGGSGDNIDFTSNGLNGEVFNFSRGIRVGNAVGENVEVGGRRLYLDVEGTGGTPLEYLEFLGGEFNLSDDLDVFGTLTANSKNFVQAHPEDGALEIVYTTLEGPEASVFTRGSARLIDGVAVVALDESFAWTANPDLGLTVSLTPRGSSSVLWVETISTKELVVRSDSKDATFDYLVMGLRIGYEQAPVVRPRTRDAWLPTDESLRAQLGDRTDLDRYTPLARYRSIEQTTFGRAATDLSATEALRQAVGTHEDVASYGHSDEVEPVALANPDPEREPGIAAPRPAQVDVQPVAAPRPTHLALTHPASGSIEAGDLVALDPVSGLAHRAAHPLDPTVIGVALGAPIVSASGEVEVEYAVAGVVTLRVDATDRPISAGDALVAASMPGHAASAAAAPAGTVVAKALEPLEAGLGEIRVLVAMR